ncbi:cupin domain protein [Collimonas arenae]|nr:cupin domain protein [Collimonas arenae]
MTRPACIKNWQEIRGADDSSYPDSAELMSIGSPFGRTFGLTRIGIHHELLKPGRRTSWPHAEKTEEEFAYVIEGTPDVWLDGYLHRLAPGDAVGFPAGTGIAHTFINNTDSDVRMLVVGECFRATTRCAIHCIPTVTPASAISIGPMSHRSRLVRTMVCRIG